MSLKNKTRNSPRAMPVEEIVTRFKSAQSRRKLCQKSVPKKTSRCKRPAKSLRKVKVVKPTKDESSEFYPNKLKRKATLKKVFLAPKHDYKVVATQCNKRKLSVPRKEIKCKQNFSSLSDSSGESHIPRQQTIMEMIELIEDTGNFDDDDLMEILTCPSPVWWEDPPDGYMEDPISQISSGSDTKTKIEDESTKENNAIEVSHAPEEDKSKHKNNSRVQHINNNHSPLLDVNIKINNPNFYKKRGKLEYVLGNLKKIKTAVKITNVNSDASVLNSKSTSSLDLQEHTLNEDIVLKTLENMEIPIDNTFKTNDNCICIDNEKGIFKRQSNFIKQHKNPNLKQNEGESEVIKNEVTNVLNKIIEIDDSDCSIKELDNISASTELNTLKDVKVSLNEPTMSALKYLETDTSDFVTVYKIIQSEKTDKKNSENEHNGRINSYFKNCKNLRRYFKKNLDVESNTDSKKCIVVSENETVKYCLKCSAIFDSEDCIYCMQSNNSSV